VDLDTGLTSLYNSKTDHQTTGFVPGQDPKRKVPV